MRTLIVGILLGAYCLANSASGQSSSGKTTYARSTSQKTSQPAATERPIYTSQSTGSKPMTLRFSDAQTKLRRPTTAAIQPAPPRKAPTQDSQVRQAANDVRLAGCNCGTGPQMSTSPQLAVEAGCGFEQQAPDCGCSVGDCSSGSCGTGCCGSRDWPTCNLIRRESGCDTGCECEKTCVAIPYPTHRLRRDYCTDECCSLLGEMCCGVRGFLSRMKCEPPVCTGPTICNDCTCQLGDCMSCRLGRGLHGSVLGGGCTNSSVDAGCGYENTGGCTTADPGCGYEQLPSGASCTGSCSECDGACLDSYENDYYSCGGCGDGYPILANIAGILRAPLGYGCFDGGGCHDCANSAWNDYCTTCRGSACDGGTACYEQYHSPIPANLMTPCADCGSCASSNAIGSTAIRRYQVAQPRGKTSAIAKQLPPKGTSQSSMIRSVARVQQISGPTGLRQPEATKAVSTSNSESTMFLNSADGGKHTRVDDRSPVRRVGYEESTTVSGLRQPRSVVSANDAKPLSDDDVRFDD